MMAIEIPTAAVVHGMDIKIYKNDRFIFNGYAITINTAALGEPGLKSIN